MTSLCPLSVVVEESVDAGFVTCDAVASPAVVLLSVGACVTVGAVLMSDML